MSDPNSSSTYGVPPYTSDTTPNTHSNPGSGIGTRIKGAVRVVHGFGESLRGSAMGLLDNSLNGDGAARNAEIANKGSMEIQRGMAELKGQSYTASTATTATTTAAPPSVENSMGYGGGATVQQPAVPVSSYGTDSKGGYNAPTTTSTTTAPATGNRVFGGTGSTTTQQPVVPPVSSYGTEYKGVAAGPYQAPSTSAKGPY